ncbi:MAG: hypothetical protein ACI81G_001373 [Gammaproteobacteria bacterium]
MLKQVFALSQKRSEHKKGSHLAAFFMYTSVVNLFLITSIKHI